MTSINIVCPHCGFSQSVEQDKIPAGNINVTCPQCKQRFTFNKYTAGAQQRPSASFTAPMRGAKPEQSPGAPQRPQPITPPPLSAPQQQNQQSRNELSGFGELFSQSWEIYKRRIWPLIALYCISVLLMVIPFAVFVGGGYLLSSGMPDMQIIVLIVGPILGAVLGSIGFFIGLAGLICAVADEQLGIGEALREGKKRMWPFAWVFSLAGFIITGGFLLFLIPGIIFTIWFIFAQYILASEDERGMTALLKSKELIRGHWFNIFGKLFLVGLLSVVIGMIPVIGTVLPFIFTPFTMIFTFLIYQDLKAVKNIQKFSCTTGEKAKWLVIASLGYIILPVVFYFLILPNIDPLKFIPGQNIPVNIPANVAPLETPPPPPVIPQPPAPVSPPEAPYQPTPPAIQQPVVTDGRPMYVYIFSYNYKGKVTLNGADHYIIEGVKNMSYNSSSFPLLKHGENTFVLEYESLPDASAPEFTLRVKERGSEAVLNQWTITDTGSGKKSFVISIP